MIKFNEKALTVFPNAFYYTAMQLFDQRMSNVNSELERLNQMRTEQHRLFELLDNAYNQTRKSQLSDVIKKKDEERDSYAFVMMHVAKLWADKIKDDTLSIHGRRVMQIFKDFDFRLSEALVAQNAKIINITQQFTNKTLSSDLSAMGLTEVNKRMSQLTNEIVQLISQRNEELSNIVVGELKSTRETIDNHYRSFIKYLNAVQELQPEETISLAAQYYNADLAKIDIQIAQSRKKSNVTSTENAVMEESEAQQEVENEQ